MSQICCQVHHLFSKLPESAFPFQGEAIPQKGIYALFEKAELAHQGDKIVRVGTHTGNDNLSSRINGHFIKKTRIEASFA
jgi:hypothetical protein